VCAILHRSFLTFPAFPNFIFLSFMSRFSGAPAAAGPARAPPTASAAVAPPSEPPTWWNTVTLIGSTVGSAAFTVGSVLVSTASSAVVSAAGAVSAAVVARSTGSAPAEDAAFAPPPVAGASLVDPILRAEQLRAEAHALKLNRDHHYRDSQAAFARGDGAAAKLASERRKQTQQRIEALRAQAATLLFAHYNHGRPLNEIDLHGLYVEEALTALRTRINACEKRLRTAGSLTATPSDVHPSLPSVHLLVVIVGRGNHSRDKIAKLRPAVEELIRTHRLRVHADTPNDGCLTIEFGSKEPSGWVGRITDACAIM
jgi:hypothetical protein